MPKPCHLCIRLVWLCQHKMVMMLQKQHIPLWLGDLIAILCVFLLRKQFTHYICRKTIYALFCHENDLRIPSGKFLRVEFRHPESSDFLGLWPEHMRRSTLSLTNIFCNHFPGRRSHLSTQKMQSKHVTMYAPITGKIVFQVWNLLRCVFHCDLPIKNINQSAGGQMSQVYHTRSVFFSKENI